MKIVFLSNFYNHHQAYISRKLHELTNGNYKFICATALENSRKELGYPEFDDEFVILFDGKDQTIQSIIDSADVVICGSAPEAWIKNRKKQKKLIFRYSERPLKNGLSWWKYPYRFYKFHKKNPPKVPIYMLCASAYTSVDYAKFGLFKGKCFKWGYFPECNQYENIKALISGKIKNEILWCGRFLDWKHPCDVLEIAKKLKADGKYFHITMIGIGEMEAELKEMESRYELSEYITFLGSVSTQKVREYMEKASIYLFTSDRKEGWGAVLNEAMNSACAVVASDAAGSTPYLVKSGENGIVYPSGDIEALYKAVAQLLDSAEMQSELGIKAYETIINEWNADNAAVRFVCLAEKIISGEKKLDLYSTGPCSEIKY